MKVEILGNLYYDNYSTLERRAIASHETGHGFSMGHIPQSHPAPALMTNDPNFFYTIYQPQAADIGLVNQIYP